MPPDPYDPHQQQQAPPAQAPVAPGNVELAQPAYPASNNYPAAEVQAVPGALARAAMTRVNYNQAQSGVHNVVDQLVDDFEYSPEMIASVRTEKLAYGRYLSARAAALREVELDQRYKTLKNLCTDLNDRLYQLKNGSESNPTEILATAELKLVYATRMSDMENDALTSDSATQEAKAKLVEASARVSELRADFKRTVRRDDKFVAAKKEMNNANIARITSAAYLEGALEARNIALNYAAWYTLRDPARYYGGYGSYWPYDYGNYGGTYYGYSGYGINSGLVIGRPRRAR